MWAHIYWIFYEDKAAELVGVKDLQQDPLLRFQHKYYIPLAIFASEARHSGTIRSLVPTGDVRSQTFEDFELIDYRCHEPIKAPIAV